MKIEYQQGMSQKLSLMEPIKLGRVRSVSLTWSFSISLSPHDSFQSSSPTIKCHQVKLLCPEVGTGTQFALAGSSGFSLLTGFLLTTLAGCIAFLGIVWRRGRRRNEDCQGREEEEEEQLHRCDLKKEEREPGCEDWTVIDWKLSYVIQKMPTSTLFESMPFLIFESGL